MKICERCSCNHDGTYGTGRYCSKKCAFTKTEKQLEAARKPYSEEIKQKMRKPKKDSSKMGKYDKRGDNNPNSKFKNGLLADRDGEQYENICASNKRNGQGWNDEIKKQHSEKMLGCSNWMRGKEHSEKTKQKISETQLKRYKNCEVNFNRNTLSKAEREISKFLSDNNIEHIIQYGVKGALFRYDFYILKFNLIVEYNGDYWHANPLKYNENDIVGRGNSKMTAKERWEYDNIKEQHATKNGYKFKTIWEYDFKKEGMLIIKNILKDENFVSGQ